MGSEMCIRDSLEEPLGKKSISFVPHTKMPSALKLKNETRADLIRFRSLPGPERPNTTDAVFLSVFNAYF